MGPEFVHLNDSDEAAADLLVPRDAQYAESVALLAERERASTKMTILGAIVMLAITVPIRNAFDLMLPVVFLWLASALFNHALSGRILDRITARLPFAQEMNIFCLGYLIAGAAWAWLLKPIGQVILKEPETLGVGVVVIMAMGLMSVTTALVPRIMHCFLIGVGVTLLPSLLNLIPQHGVLPVMSAVLLFVVPWGYGRKIAGQMHETIKVKIRNDLLVKDMLSLNSQLAHALAKSEDISNKDSLTNLLTRRAFEKKAKEARKLDLDSPSHLVLLDLDYFKEINDQYGHHMGDDILCLVSKVLRDNVRPCDFVARWGGEEFAIGMANIDFADAIKICETIRARIDSIGHPSWAQDLSVSVSIGLATWDVNEPLNVAMASADEALYDAKNSGRNCVKQNVQSV